MLLNRFSNTEPLEYGVELRLWRSEKILPLLRWAVWAEKRAPLGECEN
jgi:hypothetical protein